MVAEPDGVDRADVEADPAQGELGGAMTDAAVGDPRLKREDGHVGCRNPTVSTASRRLAMDRPPGLRFRKRKT
jgi:hypothetical protein